jgi:tetratricopeptide (TPR) repeat protein
VNRALADYEAAAAKDPTDVAAQYDIGYVYEERGDKTAAATQYRKALVIDPTFESALYNMGVLEASIDPASAIAYYLQALAVQPNNASANFNLGVLLIKKGEKARGDSYLEKGLRLNPALVANIPPGISVPTGGR